MNLVLLWLAVPLVFAPLVSRTATAGVARLLTGAIALAILWQGSGTLDPTDLAGLGRLSPDDARFIAFSAGIGIAALLIAPQDTAWGAAPAVPLAVGLVMSIVPSALPIAALGTVIALVPRAGAALVARSRRPPDLGDDAVSITPRALAMPTLAAVAIGAQGPFLLTVAMAFGITEWSRSGAGSTTPWRWPLLRPVVVFVLLVLAYGLVATVAGDPLVMVRGAEQSIPASPALERLVAALVLAAALAMVAPAERRELARNAAIAPAAVLLAATALQIAPQGAGHWAPLAAAVVVLLVAVAMWRRTPLHALAPIAVLGAIMPGAGWPTAALLLALYPVVVVAGGPKTSPRGDGASGYARVLASGAAISLAFVLRGVLTDEVVWALLLSVLCTTAACVAARDTGTVA